MDQVLPLGGLRIRRVGKMNGCVIYYHLLASTRLHLFLQKVLLGLFVAIVVAVAEAVLYFIWESRRSEAGSTRVKPRRKIVSARHKKNDGPEGPELNDADSTAVGDVTDEGLRRRQ